MRNIYTRSLVIKERRRIVPQAEGAAVQLRGLLKLQPVVATSMAWRPFLGI
jgi:hypothetical protein